MRTLRLVYEPPARTQSAHFLHLPGEAFTEGLQRQGKVEIDEIDVLKSIIYRHQR